MRLFPAPLFVENPLLSTQPQGDFLWRILLTLGAIPAVITFYLRMKMPKPGRCTALIEGNATQAAADMGRVPAMEIQAEPDKLSKYKDANNYSFIPREFLIRYGRHLIGTMTSCLFLDKAFYSQNFTQKYILTKIGLKARKFKAIEEVYVTSSAMFVVALCGTFPGYWFTVFLIDIISRFTIRFMGFFLMSLFMLTIGLNND